MKNILLLFVTTLVVALYSYKHTLLKSLSPTFWVAASVCLFSGIYCLTQNLMLNDICETTLYIFWGGICAVALGCYTSNLFDKKGKESILSLERLRETNAIHTPIAISKNIIIIFTFLYFIVAATRLMTLSRLTGINIRQILEMLSEAREAVVYAEETVVLSGLFFNQLCYAFECSIYIVLYVYCYNLLIAQKKDNYLLLPLLPDFINRVATTSRSTFILLYFAAIFIFILISKIKKIEKARSLVRKFIFYTTLLSIVFVWYGMARNKVNINIIDYIQMFTCSAIYDFDYYVREYYSRNIHLGYYTLQKLQFIFSWLNIRIEEPYLLGTIYFNKNNEGSNIYTSLLQTVNDYGFFGMLILRYLESFFGALLIRFSILKQKTNAFYYLLYFYIITLYSFVNFPIGNRFGDFLGEPFVLIRYYVYGFLITKYFIKPRIIDNTLETNQNTE